MKPRSTGRSRARGVVLLVLAAVGAGCQHAAKAPDDERTSFRFMVPPPSPSKSPEGVTMSSAPPTERVLPADPILPLATPVYPPIPARERPATAMVGVRLTIDTAGRVADVGLSVQAFTTPGPHAAAFRAAVEAAVAQWRFTPAELHQLEPLKGPNPHQYFYVRGSQPIEWSYDVAFTFNASGDVTSGPSK